MSLKALSDYTIYARYAHYLPEKKRRETWEEITDRVFDMHAKKYAKQLEKSEEFRADFEFAKDMVKKRRVLGSQRALQFGGKWIENHETKLFNCLGVETEFITSEGVRSFRDFVDGQEITVLTHEGRWKRAVVRCYGEQRLNVLTFNRRGDYSTVRATANHTWLLKDGTRTQDVAIGDKLLGAPNIFAQFDYDDASPLERLYWCYGYTFGDGTLIIGKDGQRKHSMVRLCKNEIDYRYRFEQMGFSTTTSASLKGDFIAFTGTYLKTLPDPKVDSPELLRAFIRGFLDADGAKTGTQREAPEGSLFHSIQSSYPAAIAFLRSMLPVAGFYITGEDNYTGQETNFGVRPYTIRFRGMTSVNRKNGPAFYVSDIQEGPIEPVWCLEVEDDHSFVLKNGVVTGNCSYTYIDRPQVFQEIDYLLLCGCGVGFSVQKHHVKVLPNIDNIVKNKVIKHVIQDSIEGWADAAGALINSYFVDSPIWGDYKGKRVEFDYSLIRPAGALIAGQFKAPGPKGLEASLEKIRVLIERRLASAEFATDEFAGKLRPIDTYDIVMHISDSVLSGGIRRSATISLFSYDDREMMSAKTGDWYISNPQRGRSNNSVLLVRDQTTWEQFKDIIESTKQFGEPGFYFASSTEHGANPCVEIGLYPKTKDGRSGVQFCNLCEINGKWCDSVDKFLEACRAASIIGTLQAGYTDFKYLSPESSEITAQEALLGVSITGVMDNPEILLSPKIQRLGATKCKEVNKRTAELIGINAAARITCTKPAGSTSCVLQTASGIHPHHARRYLRRVQANELEFPLQHFKSVNPDAVEPSVWSANGTDDVISFVCEVPKGAILKNDLSATELLGKVKSSQINWVLNGENPELCLSKDIHHNISNTINVRPDEWDKVAKYIYENREYFTGISLLSSSGDLDYPQAPFATVLTPEEIVSEYGDGSILASGLVVDGLHAFGGNLWAACDAALGFGEKIDDGQEEPEQPKKPRNKGFKSEKAYANALADYAIELNLFYQKMGEYRQINLKLDWIRRAKQFADRHFGGDLRRATYCLKHVSLWHTWLNLKRTYKEIDWSTVVEETQDHVAADTLGAQACAGGKCLV